MLMSSFNNMYQQQQQRRWCIASRIVLFFSSFYIWIILLAFPSRWTKIAAVKSLQVLLPLSSSRQIIAASVAKSKSKSTFRLDAVGTFSTAIEQEITTRYNNETTSGVTASASYFPSSLPSSTTASAAAAALDTSIALPDLYEEEIRQYLRASSSSYSSASSLDQFHIHGWRWHTKSLVRDAGRLHQLAVRTMSKSDGGVSNNNNNAKILKDASDYVIGFNLVGLHKIETSFFFPWMRDKLTTAATIPLSSSIPTHKSKSRQRELSSSFSYVMDKLENDRRTVDHLGTIISRNANIVASSSNNNNHKRVHAIQEIVDRSAQLQSVAQRMMDTEEQLLVPAIALMVPEREQKSFNQKVLLKLGLLDSRLHLVGMYETLLRDHSDNDKEQELFHKAIPALSRKMIPRWKRKLYEPKTYMLE